MRKPVSTIFLSILTLLSIFIIGNNNISLAEDSPEKQAIILIMDYVDTADIINADTPNLDALVEKSGTGLMNIRAKNRYPSSSYMSLSVGARVGTISHAELSFNSRETVKEIPNLFKNGKYPQESGELYTLFTGRPYPPDGVVNLFTEPLIKNASHYNPVYEIGRLGTMARDNGLNIAVLGNADTSNSLNRNAAILAMDEFGIVPRGNVSQELLENNPKSLGGVRSNHKVLLSNMEEMLKTSDILVIDLGDTSRIEESRENCADDVLLIHRKNAIERNDKLLGEIIERIDMKSTMLAILTPNPNKEMFLNDNFGLTPIIIYTPEANKGLLSSNTTRRMGVVSNSDFLPTVLSYFDCGEKFNSVGMTTIKVENNSFEILDQKLNLFKQLRKSRNPLHYVFMLLALLTILGGYLIYVEKKKKLLPYLNFVIFSTLSIPIIFLFLGYTRYFSVAGTILISLIAAIITGFLLVRLVKDPIKGLILLTGVTALLLTIDCFRGSPLMLLSPLGSDAIAGGRYYGIGNDYMGVLLASSVISITLLLDKVNIKPVGKALIGGVPLTIIGIAIGHPHYGANVGGLITAIVTTGIFLLVIMERKLSLKQFVIIGIIAVLGVLIVARLDAMFSSNPSHAGKAINSLISGGPTIFKGIIITKLSILGSTIYHSNWSIILLISLLTLVISWRKSRSTFLNIAKMRTGISKAITILIISSLTVFLVNDTGVIAAALIILYLICCMWIGLYHTQYYQQRRR